MSFNATKPLLSGLLTALIGIIAILLPPSAELESELGLDWLFSLRGPRLAPDEVVIISLDRESSARLGLPNAPVEWPRAYHAGLVRSLTKLGAKVIAFDLNFSKGRDPTDDRLFADALRAAGNVVLFEYLTRERRPVVDTEGTVIGEINVERISPTFPVLAEAAVALAPFPLPKLPVQLNQFWLFKGSAGSVPTLPVIAFQMYAEPFRNGLLELLRESASEIGLPMPSHVAVPERYDDPVLTARELRSLIHGVPDVAEHLLSKLQGQTSGIEHKTSSLLARLVDAYRGPNSRYLDFYGPPGTITSVSYCRILQGLDLQTSDGRPVTLDGKAVFVGVAEQLQPEQRDGFYTVFSQPDGIDISGVEIAATAFGNILEGRYVRRLSPALNILVVGLFGVLAGVLLMICPATFVLPTTGLLGLIYIGAASYLFNHYAFWLPLAVVILIQLSQAVVSTLLWKYLDARRRNREIHHAFGHFLPMDVVETFEADSNAIAEQGRLSFGVCLATDAERYTDLSETLRPDQLRLLLNEYYAALFEPVRKHDGSIIDVVGDAMVAIWTNDATEAASQRKACHAALSILTLVDGFNRSKKGINLPTRIGLHCGQVVIGSVGAGDHFEYRAVGDTVNTASRIEGVNKYLGTRALASAEVIQDLPEILTREIGSFRVVGRAHTLVLHELVTWKAYATKEQIEAISLFTQALHSFQLGRWQEAAMHFETLLTRSGDDGPSQYYLHLCHQFKKVPPASWHSVITLDKK